MEFISNSVEETKKVGSILAKFINKGDVIVLNGDLGAGKTAFVAGVLSFYGLESDVSSPTFTIANEYVVSGDTTIFHLDVYRLENEDEFYAIGGNEYFEKGITFVEWGNLIKSAIPKDYLEIIIVKDSGNDNLRIIKLVPNGKHYEDLVEKIKNFGGTL